MGIAALQISRVLYGALTGDLRVAMALQPIVDLHTHRLMGHEALFRVPDFPKVDLPGLWEAAVRAGVVTALEDRVATVCSVLDPPAGRLFVNVDPRAPGLVRRWRGVPKIVVELSEAAEVAKEAVDQLKAAQIPIALDDVGAGKSNLIALVRVGPDFIKIDRSLVDGCHRSRRKSSMIGLLVQYAADLDVTVIAEGIEQVDEATHLASLGVTYGQGFLLGLPQVPEMMRL